MTAAIVLCDRELPVVSLMLIDDQCWSIASVAGRDETFSPDAGLTIPVHSPCNNGVLICSAARTGAHFHP